MLQITREVRLSLTAHREGGSLPGSGANTWAGWPGTTRLCPYLLVRVMLAGDVDPRTGYVCDIRDVDRVVRDAVLKNPRWDEVEGAKAVRLIWKPLREQWAGAARLVGMELLPTPFLRFGMNREEPGMVSITQSFEFAASHRLACDDLSEEENRRVFGKCSNPNGHGHNYRLDVSVLIPEGRTEAGSFALPQMETAIKDRVLERFDHKHLNTDCEEFATLIPSVENIARVIWGLLVGGVDGAQLSNVRVWETAKTWADYSE